MTDDPNNIAIMLFSELLAVDQSVRNRLTQVLPKGMEISHFSVLNNLVAVKQERSPAKLAETLNVTRGAITNTLNKLEWAGHVHVRPDWDDARRKMIGISPSGRVAHQAAISAIAPMINQVIEEIGEEQALAVLPVLRQIRNTLG